MVKKYQEHTPSELSGVLVSNLPVSLLQYLHIYSKNYFSHLIKLTLHVKAESDISKRSKIFQSVSQINQSIVCEFSTSI